MRKAFRTVLVGILVFAGSAKAQSSACLLRKVQMGPESSTPLQKEVEEALHQKGFVILTANDFQARRIEVPVNYQIRYAAGKDSGNSESDCLEENYRQFGQRFTCSYELKFQARNFLTGQWETAFEIRQSVRQVLDPTSFYDQVRSQILGLPTCLELSSK